MIDRSIACPRCHRSDRSSSSPSRRDGAKRPSFKDSKVGRLARGALGQVAKVEPLILGQHSDVLEMPLVRGILPPVGRKFSRTHKRSCMAAM
jgi:hypothetical protein